MLQKPALRKMLLQSGLNQKLDVQPKIVPDKRKACASKPHGDVKAF